jgi:cysteine rich repeat protein
MKHLMVVLIALLIPTAAMAKSECKEDKNKFCKDVKDAKGNVEACLKQHEADLSKACKAQRETTAKAKNSAKSQ